MGVKERAKKHLRGEDDNSTNESAKKLGVRERAALNSFTKEYGAWEKSTNDFITNHNKRYFNGDGTYNDAYRADTSEWYQQAASQQAEIDSKRKELLGYLEDMRGAVADDVWSSYRDILSSDLSDLVEIARNDNDIMSQYSSADEYDYARMSYQERDAHLKEKRNENFDRIGEIGLQLADQSLSPSERRTLQVTKEKLEAENAEYTDRLRYNSDAQLSIADLEKQRDAAETADDKLYYMSLISQKDLLGVAEILGDTKMTGENVSVLDAMNGLAKIEDKTDQKQRREEIKARMADVGIDFDRYYSRITGESNVTAENFFKWLGAAAKGGLDSWAAGVTGTVDKIIGEPLESLFMAESSPIGDVADLFSDVQKYNSYDVDYYADVMGGGTGFRNAGEFIQGATGAIPDFALAWMTGGLSKGTSLTTQAARATGGSLTKTGITVQNMVKNPSFWSSFARTYSMDYEEAIALGASDPVAAFGSVISSLINAGIEIGLDGASGIQGLTQSVKNGEKRALYAWIESSLQEGGEEILQGFVNNAVAKALYDSEVELVDAGQMLKEGLIGTGVGALLGGGQVALTAPVNKAAERYQSGMEELGRRVDDDVIAQLREIAASMDQNSQAYLKVQQLDSDSSALFKGETFSQVIREVYGNQSASVVKEILLENGASEVEAKSLATEFLTASEKGYMSGKVKKAVQANPKLMGAWRTLTNSTERDVAYRLREAGLSAKESTALAEEMIAAVSKRKVSPTVANAVSSSVAVKEVYDSLQNEVKFFGISEKFIPNSENKKALQKIDRTIKAKSITPRIISKDAPVNKPVEERAFKAGQTDVAEDAVETAGIAQIASINDGVMTLELTDGSRVDAAEYAFASEDEALVYESVLHMGANADTANALVQQYRQGNVAANTYVRGIAEAYIYGLYGLAESEMSLTTFTADLSAEQRHTAYRRGQTDAKAAVEAEQAKIDNLKRAVIQARSTGEVYNEDGTVLEESDSLTETQKASIRALKSLAKALKLDFYVYESYVDENGKRVWKTPDGTIEKAPNGFFVGSDNKIHVDLNAGLDGEGTMLYTVSHELGHFIKKWSPKKFKALADFLAKTYGKHGWSVSACVKIQQAKAKLNGRELSFDEAYEEFVCDSLARMLTDGDAAAKIQALQKYDASIVAKIKEFFADLASKLKAVRNAYKDTDLDSVEGRFINESLAEFDRLQQLFAEGLVDAADAYNATEQTKNTAEDGGVKNQIRDAFYSQLDNWDKATTGFSFVLGTTSPALQEAGIPDKQIRLDATKAKTLLEKHNGMTVDVIRQLPELLEKPVVVIDSKQNKDAKIVMGDLTDKNGKIVTVVLLLTPTSKKGNLLDVIKISSAEGRGHIKSLFKNTDGTNVPIRFVDKKRIQSWLNANRLQLPLHSFNSDSSEASPPKSVHSKNSNAGVKKVPNASKNSISNSAENVKEKSADRDTAEDGGVKSELRNDIDLIVDEEYTAEVATSFGITQLNDYIHVQKQVFNTLIKEGFFTDEGGRSRTVVNQDSGMVVEINKSGIDETFGEKNWRINKRLKTAKLATIRNISHLIETGTLEESNVPNVHGGSTTFAYIVGSAQVNGKPVTVRAAIKQSMRKNKFWIHQISVEKDTGKHPAGVSKDSKTGSQNSGVGNRLPHSGTNVKKKNSDRDTAGRRLTAEQQEFFKDSKVRDENGNLIALYHGTENGGFTVFDPARSDDHISLFFTDDIRVAETYSGTDDNVTLPAAKPPMLRWTEGNTKRGKQQAGVYEVYLNLKNPLVIDCEGETWGSIPFGGGTPVELSYHIKHGEIVFSVKAKDRPTQTVRFADNANTEAEVRKFLTKTFNKEIGKRYSKSFALSREEDVDYGWKDSFVRTVGFTFNWDFSGNALAPTSTREIAAWAKKEGYDGVIFRDLHDYGGHKVKGVSYASKKTTNIYVAFNKNAIKDVDNKTPTANKDIRYSSRNSVGGVMVDSDTQSVAPKFSERTWTNSEYVQERKKAAKAIADAIGVDLNTAYAYIDNINSVARLIADDRARLDYDPNIDDNATVLKPNSDYKYSVDMSTLCAKRLLFTGTFDAIQKALPHTVFDSDDIVTLRKMMQQRGLEVACGICYVESTRREIGRITQEFIDRYKIAQQTGKPISRINSKGEEVVLKSAGKTFSADKAYTPNLGELNTTDIDLVKRDHPEVYEAYLAFMNARGQAKPKLLETRAEYKGEILKHFRSKSSVQSLNAAGGLRLQSFSDFEVPHLIDMMQVVMDMARVGLKSQAYTKVPAFAEAFGNTGVKINLSLIAKGSGLDADGNLVFDDVEGINHEEAFRLRDKFSKTVGTILVGKNDAHIIAAMADPRIDFIIPFHKSSWKESLYDALGLTGYEDYTNFQTEKAIDGSKIKSYAPSEYWDYSKTGDENAQIYLQKCRDEGRIPVFPQFQGYPGYWKLLIDFKMYDNDGVGAPQEVVRPIFDEAANEKILREYKGGHKSFPVAQDVVDEFVEKYRDGEDSVRKDIRFSNRNPIDKSFQQDDNTSGIYSEEQYNAFGWASYNGVLSAKERETLLSRFADFKHNRHNYPVTRWGEAVIHATETPDVIMYIRSTSKIGTPEITRIVRIVADSAQDISEIRERIIKNEEEQSLSPYASVTAYCGEEHLVFHRRRDHASFQEYRSREEGRSGKAVVSDPGKQQDGGRSLRASEGSHHEDGRVKLSDRDYAELERRRQVDRALRAENERLQEDVGRLREVLAAQGEPANGRRFSKTAVEAAATQLMQRAGARFRGDKAELVSMLNAVYNDLASDDDLRWETVAEKAQPIVEWMLAHRPVDSAEQDYYRELTARELLADVYDSFWNATTLHAVTAEIDRLKGKHKQQMKALRERRDAKIKALKTEYRERIKRIREQKNAAMDREISRTRETYRHTLEKRKEATAAREARAKLQKLVLETAKWLAYPSKTDVKCPDVLREPYAEFLSSIDLTSKRQLGGGAATHNDARIAHAMNALALSVEKVSTAQDGLGGLDAGYLDLPEDFVQELREVADGIKADMTGGQYVINNMKAEDIRKVSKLIRQLNHAIRNMSKLHANARFADAKALGVDTVKFLDALGKIQKTSEAGDWLTWDNGLPVYMFDRFGDAGKSIFEELMDAQDKLAFHADAILKHKEANWTDKEVRKWSEDVHPMKLPSGVEITLTTADAMGVYLTDKREEGRNHLYGSKTRIAGYKKGGVQYADSEVYLTPEDVAAIVESLSNRQIEVADAIQRFMSTVAAGWGNEISMKRHLVAFATDPNYYPLETVGKDRDVELREKEQSNLYRLLNISAAKPLTPGAHNSIIIRNVFDVFTQHTSDMARMNAYGMALLDTMKWLNYRESTTDADGVNHDSGVRESMEAAYGKAAEGYVLNLIKDINGRVSDSGDPTIMVKWLRMAKTANVGFNLRVAALQLTAYPRAAMVLSTASLAKGLTKVPQIQKARKYCGIALWKSFGFYDTNIARSIEDQIKGTTNIRQKIVELSLKGAEYGDAITWGALWNACEYEVAATGEFKVGSEEFNEAVAKKLREVVYRTQVVDSQLTRSQNMRQKSGMAQEAYAFMSEPTISANILMDAGFQFNLEKRRTGSVKLAWKKAGKHVCRAISVFASTGLMVALVGALSDAWHDDDDEEYGKKFMEAFGKNVILELLPFNKVPILADMSEAALSLLGVGYFSTESMASQWLSQAVMAINAWKSVLNGNSSTTVYSALYKTVRVLSSFSGIAFSGAMREAVALWNNTAGAIDSELKIRTSELSDAKRLSNALENGDTAKARELVAEIVEEKMANGKTATEAKASVRSSMTSYWKPLFLEAYQAKDNAEMTRIRRLLKESGVYEDVIETTQNWIKSLAKK